MKKLLNWLPALFTIVAVVFTYFVAGASPVQIMPFAAIGTYACQKIQTDLISYYGKNAPQYRTLGSVAFIKWLLSPQNTSGFRRIDVESIPGKKRGVAFMVDDPYCFNLCALAVDCTTEDIVYADPATREVVFDLSNDPFRHCDADGKAVKLRFKEADLMKYCTITDQSYITNQISRYLLRFEEALSKALTTILNTQVGNNGNDEALTTIPLFTAASNYNPNMSVLNPEGLWYMDQVYRNIGMDNQYALIGGEIVSKISEFKKWATANDAGVDLSKATADRPYLFYDRNFNSTFGQSDMIMLAPGATQLVTWNKYKGEKNRKVTDLYSNGTIILPTTGLEVDWKWRFDYECEEWIFEAFLHAELATVIKGGCGANLANVNGIIRVHDCGTQPIVPACPPQVSA